MTDDDPPCPACGETLGSSFEAENGRVRIWCAFCGHSTGWHDEMGLARLEWLGSGDETDG